MISPNKERFIWIWYLYWLGIPLLGLVANAVGVFDLSPCSRFSIFSALAFLGGLGLIIFSLTPRNKNRFKNWDRVLTAFLAVVVTGAFTFLSIDSCTQNSPTATFEYQVRVQDGLSSQPIQNAEVIIEGSGFAPRNDLTDVNGVAIVRIDVSHVGELGRLIVEAQGYPRHVENINLLENELPDVVALEPQP
jgi:hypothetical protein